MVFRSVTSAMWANWFFVREKFHKPWKNFFRHSVYESLQLSLLNLVITRCHTFFSRLADFFHGVCGLDGVFCRMNFHWSSFLSNVHKWSRQLDVTIHYKYFRPEWRIVMHQNNSPRNTSTYTSFSMKLDRYSQDTGKNRGLPSMNTAGRCRNRLHSRRLTRRLTHHRIHCRIRCRIHCRIHHRIHCRIRCRIRCRRNYRLDSAKQNPVQAL